MTVYAVMPFKMWCSSCQPVSGTIDHAGSYVLVHEDEDGESQAETHAAEHHTGRHSLQRGHGKHRIRVVVSKRSN